MSRTYDQDTDADLWRESGLFIKKKGRYICFSKTEGQPDCVVEDIVVINERDTPPEGYCMISYTVDSSEFSRSISSVLVIYIGLFLLAEIGCISRR